MWGEEEEEEIHHRVLSAMSVTHPPGLPLTGQRKINSRDQMSGPALLSVVTVTLREAADVRPGRRACGLKLGRSASAHRFAALDITPETDQFLLIRLMNSRGAGASR